jgi:WD40 repeat protein
MATQRLAVGTDEGAIVMYDLKTATRLYVLECHKKALAACSFSPDGRRLATVSLAEGAVLVWKVGSSFASFFSPGAPPRQGHAGSEPFKSLGFNVGDAGEFFPPIDRSFGAPPSWDFPVDGPLILAISRDDTRGNSRTRTFRMDSRS